MQEALEKAEMIMVVVPSSAHADIAKNCAPYLKDGQMVVLHPGRTCGAIEFAKVLRDLKLQGRCDRCRSRNFYLCFAHRMDRRRRAFFASKRPCPWLPCRQPAPRLVLDRIHEAYPQFIDGGNVLQTGLNNMGAIFHPALTILNTGWIESTHGDYQFYIEGVTPSVARVLEALDRERVTVASSLGIRARTALEWLKLAYDTTGEDLNEAIHNQPGYYGIKAPPTLNHRYIFEDVPMSLVPIASLGQRYGVSVQSHGCDHPPGLRSFIALITGAADERSINWGSMI